MLTWQRDRENGYEAQRGWVLGEPLYQISRAHNGQWHVYFRGKALAGTEAPRPGQHYHTMRWLRNAAEAHFAQTFLPRLLQVLRGP